jgi:hypothetical protein
VSELLDRVRREIRERLESTRAAVFEYERLEAALDALGDTGSRATRAVRGSGRAARASQAARGSRAAAKPSTRARTSERRSGASGTAERAGRGRSGAASASAGAAGASGRERARSGASGRTDSAHARSGVPAPAGTAAPARKRAARGANREAVLRVVGERPGVTARELAAASTVTGGTLYTLLRRLTDEGTLAKRELPGGQTGYARATSAAAAAQPGATEPQAATSETGPGAQSPAPERPARDRADSTQTADAAREAAAGTQSG